jgi:parvulin-like peptidyl-prolyl isomerase
MRKSTFTSILVPLVALVALACGERDPWVARVANERIRISELVESYKAGKPANVLQRATKEKLRAHLNQLIDERLKLLEAYRQGLDRDSSVVARLKNEEKKRVYDMVIDQEVVEKVIPETERREFYSNMGVEVRARHIFLGVKPKASAEEEKAVRDKIEAIRDELLQGADFVDLVKKYSQDPETALDGGDLGYLRWGPNPIQQAAFKLEPGEISEPVRSRFGYHLVKAEEKRSVRLLPFEQMDSEIKATLRRHKSKEVQAAGEKYIDDLMKRYHFAYHRQNVERIAARLAPADSARRKGRLIPIDSLLTAEDLDLVLAEYDGGKVVARELAIYRRYPTTLRQIRDWIARKVRRDLIVLEGYRLGFHKSQSFRERLQAFKEDLLRKEIERRQVDDRMDGRMPEMAPTKENLAEINLQAQQVRAERQQRLRAWLAELRQRYPVVIDERRLEEAVAEVRGEGN